MSCCRCFKCGKSLDGGMEMIKCVGCGSIQPPPPTRSEPTCCPDYYRLLCKPLQSPLFNIDLKALKREYLNLQAAVHPDKMKEGMAQSWSSWINRANETLRDPLQRAIYLVNLYEKKSDNKVNNKVNNKVDNKVDNCSDDEIIDDVGHFHDISLVLEVREEIDSTDDPAILSRIKQSNDERINSCCNELAEILDVTDGIVDLAAAKRCINKLRYWMSIDRELKER